MVKQLLFVDVLHQENDLVVIEPCHLPWTIIDQFDIIELLEHCLVVLICEVLFFKEPSYEIMTFGQQLINTADILDVHSDTMFILTKVWKMITYKVIDKTMVKPFAIDNL